MVLLAALFLDQVFQQLLPDGNVVATRMNAANIRRESTNMRVVLPGIFRQHRLVELALGPGHIKRVFEHGIFHHSVT
jgi:hypothetical protein